MLAIKPTTTGGSAIPVFTTLSTRPRPGNRVKLRAAPNGMPSTKLKSVAPPETLRDSHMIRITAGSPSTMSRMA